MGFHSTPYDAVKCTFRQTHSPYTPGMRDESRQVRSHYVAVFLPSWVHKSWEGLRCPVQTEVSTAQSEKIKHQQGSIGRSEEHRAKPWEGNFSPGLCWDDTKSSPLSKAKAGSAAISTVRWKETVFCLASTLLNACWAICPAHWRSVVRTT